jgi:hypothetical protein
MLHALAHYFGWNTGHCYSWWDSNTGCLMMGFRCTKCGDIGGVHVVKEPISRSVKP